MATVNMEDKVNHSEKSQKNKFAELLPSFDEAMKKIVATPKSEVERRERAERDAKSSSK